MIASLLVAGWAALGVVAARQLAARIRERNRLQDLYPARPARVVSLPAAGSLDERLAGRLVAPVRRRLEARRSGARLGRELPVLVELLRVAVSSGATPAQAMARLRPYAPPGCAPLVGRVVDDLVMGLTLAEALDALRVREPLVAPLVHVLMSSVEVGAPVEPALARLSADARADLRRAAEARARTVPVRLLFPLVFLVLPAFLLLGVVPSVLAGAGA